MVVCTAADSMPNFFSRSIRSAALSLRNLSIQVSLVEGILDIVGVGLCVETLCGLMLIPEDGGWAGAEMMKGG